MAQKPISITEAMKIPEADELTKPKAEVVRQVTHDGTFVHVAYHLDLSLPHEACETCGASSDVQRKSSIHRSRRIIFPQGSGNISGYNLQTPLYLRKSHRCNRLQEIARKKNAHKSGYDFHPVGDRKVRNSIEEPVVLFERNLHGHLLAGLLWERPLEDVLLKHISETPWECFYICRKSQLFFSVFVFANFWRSRSGAVRAQPVPNPGADYPCDSADTMKHREGHPLVLQKSGLERTEEESVDVQWSVVMATQQLSQERSLQRIEKQTVCVPVPIILEATSLFRRRDLWPDTCQLSLRRSSCRLPFLE